MSNTRILILLGSLRADSVNLKLAELAVASAPDGVDAEIYLGGLDAVPFYNEDLDVEAARPEAAVRLRAAVGAADAVLIVTPEYNGGLPAVVKNAIDWLSRPYGDSVLSDKPVAVIGAAAGRFGGVWAHDDARKSLGIAGARVVDEVKLSQPLSALDGRHPRENAETAAAVRDAVAQLAGLL
ncbi:NAD(P)H-dependent oxidoreductase [Mycolicibacterium brumae]|uniref:NADPH-dependent oxidoreductase n=1 Tax=Mycolicibacterium brumae TaxID=85968 RepID=A0A2G5P8G3_9MYCO|nr:NAD(P)H-dependent oxidoreductase [Mycolicibacterium brumae]MCV7194794.1 NAD(P)H-dependent oxidoreductase [Mycolicibacterium brumae]PIB74547.1 NADPH-dependent oxidoreductase [Mycolicibacterium brumae]RWA19786.1 hypothetical protein MBRU_16495 [Mycolicibacterium brumae DSM 44177]UWW09563.1 NAD(P)H-dependent oxidoreductase [Mycolicibacterium brumae]